MNPRPKARTLCRCCESAAGMLGDPNLGLVCPDCYVGLTLTRGMLEEVGPLTGIGVCSNEVDR